MRESAPRDVVMACCRDEEDLVEAFIDFYLDAGFDTVCLVDNGSRDDTVERILAHPRRERVRLLVDPRVGYDARLLDYYRAFTPEADRWFFFVDVDEFVVIPGGIKAYAAALPEEVTVLRLPTAEMLPPATGPAHPLSSTRREAAFHREGKVVWRADCQVRRIFCGKHDIEAERYSAHDDPRLYVRHYHTRSEQQFRRKLANRLETEDALTDLQRATLSLFPPEAVRGWVEDSRRLSGPGGWASERARLERISWVEDRAVAEWFAGRSEDVAPQVSPVVQVQLGAAPWQCFCVRERHAGEGHTSHEHLVLVHAPNRRLERWDAPVFAGRAGVPVRIHSECLFGDVFGGDTCDCGWQLADALRQIEQNGEGVIVYLRQEGRGIGLLDKIRSMGVPHPDSFVRNERIGHPGDRRGYRLAGRLLRALGMSSVRLLSGNPAKLQALAHAGIEVTGTSGRVPERLSAEAAREVFAKLRRGYAYTTAADGAYGG